MDRHALALAETTRLLEACATLRDPNPGRSGVSQLDHALQTATRAAHDGADDEMVAVALLHDAAKPLSEIFHGEIVALMLHEYISRQRYHVLRTHGEFQADADAAHQSHWFQPWYLDARRLARWDAASFDQAFDSLSLSHFAPLLRTLFLRRSL